MASLRFVVSEEDGTFIGQNFITCCSLTVCLSSSGATKSNEYSSSPIKSIHLYWYVRAKNKESIVSPTSVSSQMKEQQLKQIKF